MPKQKKSKLWEFIDSFGGKRPPMIAADPDDIATADFVICVLADDQEARQRFPDNVLDFCCKCDVKVQLRPHVPYGPKRICYGCAAKMKGDRQMLISQKTADESAPYLKKKQ